MLRESVARIAGVAALGALAIAVWFSIVLARADSLFRAATPEAVQRAVEIAPWNTEYLALRALQLDYEGSDSTSLTEKVARLNPFASAPRIRLGLAREVSGDFVDAEKWLLDAAGVDHQFEPRWTLANFYFRAGRREQFWAEQFWAWMRPALEVSYGDRTPAFDLCWRVSPNAEEILNRAIPDRHEVIGAYLVYLSQTKRLEAIVPVARRLAGDHDASDLPLLYGACDQLIEARDPGAVEVWRLAGQATPSGISNGDFAAAPLNHGFDWRVHETRGVTYVGHRIAFNGQQPESCSLLDQRLVLINGRHYRLLWEAKTSGIRSPAGLEWRMGEQRAALSPSQDWTQGEMLLTARGSFEALELAYRRPMGESRAEGTVELRHIRMLEVEP